MAGSFEHKADTEIIGRSGGMEVRATRPQPDLETAPDPEASPPPGTAESKARKRRRFLTEAAAVAGMTLACFAIFILFLSLSFPGGHDLRELLRSNRDAPVGLGAMGMGRGAESTATAGASIATLSVLHASVHSRTAGSIAWSSAPSGLGLRAGDGIQTGAAGTAVLNFEHGSVRLENNSLVILGGGTDVGDLLARTPRALTIVRGELFARLDKSAPGEMTVTLPEGVARLRPTVQARPAKFRISAGQDRSSAVTVFAGAMALQANGRVVNVGPGQFSRIAVDGAPSDPLPVPNAPVVLTPAPGARFAYLDLPPLVPFRWRAASGDGHFILRATGGPKFRNEIVSQATSDSFLLWGRFGPGVYEWRVSRVVNGVEGSPSAPRRLVIEQSGGPMALEVEPLPAHVARPSLEVRGRARPGATVYVMGQPARVRSDGTFDLRVDLPPGANVVLVEAVDAAGNSMYSSQVVYFEN